MFLTTCGLWDLRFWFLQSTGENSLWTGRGSSPGLGFDFTVGAQRQEVLSTAPPVPGHHLAVLLGSGE